MAEARTYPKKLLVLVGLGLGALALVLATMFTTLTEQQTDLSSTIPLAVGTEEFADAMEAVTVSPRQPVGTEVVLFNNGDTLLADLLGEIGRARSSVTVTNYIFREGKMANALFDALAERARAGVEVRVLLDWNGAKKAPDERVEALRQAGGRVAEFRPLSFRYLTRFHRRTHARAIVVDGVVGYTGGFAFDDGWLGDVAQPEQWRDVTYKFGGPLARATQDHFNALWRQPRGEVLSGPDFYPTDGTHAGHGGADSTATWTPGTGDSTSSVTVGAAGGGPTSTSTSAAPDGAEGGTITADPAAGAWFVSLFHNPVPDLSTDLQDLIWLSITGAQQRIRIATPYMTPDVDIRDAIIAAARRGVLVEILMPGPYTDAKLIQAATRAYYDELLEAGVRIFEYQPGRFHEKTLTVDGRWSIIGSANMDNRSATLNIENVFAIADPRLAAALEAESELAKARSVEVTVQSWDPNPLETAYFHLARLFAKQY